MDITVRALPDQDGAIEVVERKGIGHPDSLCDALAEAFSAALSRYYRTHFGRIFHHNVDKALLFGGASEPAFGGGRLIEPMHLYLCGRATANIDGAVVPIQEIAEETVQSWLRTHLRFVDPDRDLRLHCLVRPGAAQLRELVGEAPRCNDTSIGVGYAPLSPLEQGALDATRQLGSHKTLHRHPALGEDTKIMGVRRGDQVRVTAAVAMVDRFLECPVDYEDARDSAVDAILEAFGPDCEVQVNAADRPEEGSFYLTVTGTSAECGDDGQVGRGNRANGLITPFRPMTLEAVAGKNPVSHVGKLYNLLAQRVAAAIVDELAGVEGAHITLVSQIGRPVNDPWLADIQLHGEADPASVAAPARALLHSHLDDMDALVDALLEGAVPVC